MCVCVCIYVHELWRVKVRWQPILRFISDIYFRVSHFFRKGNKVVDILVALARESGVWFALFPCIDTLQVGLDFFGADTRRVLFSFIEV